MIARAGGARVDWPPQRTAVVEGCLAPLMNKGSLKRCRCQNSRTDGRSQRNYYYVNGAQHPVGFTMTPAVSGSVPEFPEGSQAASRTEELGRRERYRLSCQAGAF